MRPVVDFLDAAQKVQVCCANHKVLTDLTVECTHSKERGLVSLGRLGLKCGDRKKGSVNRHSHELRAWTNCHRDTQAIRTIRADA